MKLEYDSDVDAVYIRLGNKKPEGVIEISEGVNVDVTADNQIVGIEILHASEKINLDTIFSYELQLDKNPVIRKSA